MSPLLVLQNLAHNSTATLAVVKVTNAYFLSPMLLVFFDRDLFSFVPVSLRRQHFLFLGLHYSSFATRR